MSQYTLVYEEGARALVNASDLDEVKQYARQGCPPSDRTTWWRVDVYEGNFEIGDLSHKEPYTTLNITVDPEIPDCEESNHKWVEVDERGNGGGIITTEKCKHCEILKITDTWAQNPENGEEGLTSIRYDESGDDN